MRVPGGWKCTRVCVCVNSVWTLLLSNSYTQMVQGLQMQCRHKPPSQERQRGRKREGAYFLSLLMSFLNKTTWTWRWKSLRGIFGHWCIHINLISRMAREANWVLFVFTPKTYGWQVFSHTIFIKVVIKGEINKKTSTFNMVSLFSVNSVKLSTLTVC